MRIRKKQRGPAIWIVLLAVLSQYSWAHPGSGIAVDRQGQVYFTDTGHGVWKIDRQGKLTEFYSSAYHWMAFDEDGRFSRSQLDDLQTSAQDIQRFTPAGSLLTVITSSDFPITMGTDGNLYYGVHGPEGLKITRRTPEGRTSVVTTIASSADGSALQWLNGIASGPDGSLYFSENNAVRKISFRGAVTVLARGIRAPECSAQPVPKTPQLPYLRGLAVDSAGDVFVAANGCRCVLKISSTGQVRTILTAEPPWSPTGLAVRDNNVYVLEYVHTPGDNRREWTPRVRKVSAGGKVTTLATVKR